MNRINKKFAIKILVFISLAIFITFLYIDIFLINEGNSASIYLKYSTILICFIITLLIGKDGYNKRDVVLVQLARLFTVIADFFLLIKDDFKIGVLFFCIVQIIYILRHSFMEKEIYKNAYFLAVVLLISIISSIGIKINNFDKGLLSIGIFYAAFLLTSVYCGLSTLKKSRYPKGGAWLISFGIILFLLCDLNVALFNIFRYIGISKYEYFTAFLIWFFYFPSQLMLSLSGFKAQFLNSLFSIKG